MYIYDWSRILVIHHTAVIVEVLDKDKSIFQFLTYNTVPRVCFVIVKKFYVNFSAEISVSKAPEL